MVITVWFLGLISLRYARHLGGMDEPDGYPDDVYDQPFIKIMGANHSELTSRGRQINNKWNMSTLLYVSQLARRTQFKKEQHRLCVE